mmetsp:Transcript_17040/g.30531  ORF Transcript_17040/g.30531 Transcript_17040/m.30531 type:complete len:528 (-) Transcript_17040:940-2523(-)
MNELSYSSSALHLLDDFLLDVRRNEIVRMEGHLVLGAPLGDRPQRGNVLEHFGKRNESRYHLNVSTVGHFLHLATSRVEVTDNISHMLLGSGDIDLHDRLTEAGLGLHHTLPEASTTGDFESHNGRVDIVVGTIQEGGLESADGEASERSSHGFGLNTLDNTRNVLLGHGTTLDFRHELEARGVVLLSSLPRLEVDDDAGVLSGSSRLLLVGVIDFGLGGDGLTVGDLRSTDVAFDVELASHTVNDNVEVQLSHTFDDGLSRGLVTREAEGRVFLCKLVEGVGHLFLVSLRLGLDRNLDDRLGEVHLLENDVVIRVAKSLTGSGILHTDERDNVTSAGFRDLFSAVRVHENHTADALFLVLDRVDDLVSALEHTGVDTGEGEGSDVRIGGDLEREGRERLVVAADAHGLLSVLGFSLDGFDLGRGRQVVDDGVEQRLHALVLESSSEEDRHESEIERSLADELLEGCLIRLFAFEVLLHGIVVHLNGGLDKLLAVLFGLFLVFSRDFALLEAGAEVLVLPDDALHTD